MRRLTLCLLVASACCLLGCSAGGDPPNILIVTMDTLRQDRLGCYGNPRGLTPAADSLAMDSVRFSNAYAPVPITLPSHASLFTGLYPPSHGLRDNPYAALNGGYETFAEALKSRGYRTGATVAAYVLDSGYGLDLS